METRKGFTVRFDLLTKWKVDYQNVFFIQRKKSAVRSESIVTKITIKNIDFVFGLGC